MDVGHSWCFCLKIHTNFTWDIKADGATLTCLIADGVILTHFIANGAIWPMG